MTYPPRTVPEDCFDYYWIGDDHLLVYLIDVSGHGLEPARSVSVHNMLRSGLLNDPDPAGTRSGFGRTEPAVPDGTAERPLLHRVVRYEKSTRTLRYTSAGAPPAYAFTTATEKRRHRNGANASSTCRGRLLPRNRGPSSLFRLRRHSQTWKNAFFSI